MNLIADAVSATRGLIRCMVSSRMWLILLTATTTCECWFCHAHRRQHPLLTRCRPRPAPHLTPALRLLQLLPPLQSGPQQAPLQLALLLPLPLRLRNQPQASQVCCICQQFRLHDMYALCICKGLVWTFRPSS